MKLTEIKLLEAYKTDLNTLDEAWDYINKHCSDALKTIKTPIVRGMTGFKNGIGIIHGAEGNRQSANTSNHYTVILDHVLPKEFPRRGKSIICASWPNREYSEDFGVLHAIIPENNVEIGVAPFYDIWDTSISLGYSTKRIHFWNRFFKGKTFEEIVDSIKQSLIEKEDNSPFDGMDIDNIENELAAAYSEQFVSTTSKNPIYNNGKYELWIGGPCVAIELSIFEEMLKENGIK